MKGYNREALPHRDLKDVTPLRFNLLVRIHDETPKTKLIVPQQARDIKDHTWGRHGTVVAIGRQAKRSTHAENMVSNGTHILFDESVSIDDPNRCFQNDGKTFILFDIETVMATIWATGEVFPLGDQVLVKRAEKAEYKHGSIFIPITAGKTPVGGTVVAVGLGGYNEDGSRRGVEVNIGDKVIMAKYAGTDVELPGGRFVMLRQDKILATVKGDLNAKALDTSEAIAHA